MPSGYTLNILFLSLWHTNLMQIRVNIGRIENILLKLIFY